MPDDTIHESSRSRTRQGLATYLRRIARALGRGEPVPVDEGGTVTVDAAGTGDVEVELEREDGTVRFEIEVEWPDEEVAVDEDASASRATFELFRDKADEYRWRLRHENGNIIADSGQGYASKQKAKQGLTSVKSNAPGAAVEEPDE
jgi:hypothetical protein